MIISNITPPQVWTSSSRSLTNFGSGALAPVNSGNTTLAAATSVDLRSSPGIVDLASAAVLTGAAATGSTVIQMFDGTTSRTLVATAAAANATAGFTTVNNNTVGLRIQNTDGAVAANYMTASIAFTI